MRADDLHAQQAHLLEQLIGASQTVFRWFKECSENATEENLDRFKIAMLDLGDLLHENGLWRE